MNHQHAVSSTVQRVRSEIEALIGRGALGGASGRRASVLIVDSDDLGELGVTSGRPPPSAVAGQAGDPAAPAFRRWFGQSVVTDEGNARVVYHATQQSFTAFDPARVSPSSRFGPGFYFSADVKTLGVYAGEGGHLMPVYLKLERPYRDGPLSLDQVEAFFAALEDKVFQNGYDATADHERIRLSALDDLDHAFERLLSGQVGYISAADWCRGMDAMGFDGIIREVFGHEEYVVLRPGQIKSAVRNSGAFDGDNPDIMHSVATGAAATSLALDFYESQPRVADEVPQEHDFVTWFEGSKAIGIDGKPKMLFHGSGVWEKDDRKLGDFEEFDRMASVKIVRRRASLDTVGSWFSSNPGGDGAGMYAGTAGVIYPVFLRITQPWETTFRAMEQQARKLSALKDGEFVHGPAVERLREWLTEEGYDGIKIVHDGTRSDSTEFLHQDAWIALEPTQIRFAIREPWSYAHAAAQLVARPVLASIAPACVFPKSGECVILRSEGAWRLIDRTRSGGWCSRTFDVAGMGAIQAHGSAGALLAAAFRDGFVHEDKAALARVSQLAPFKRNTLAHSLFHDVADGQISFQQAGLKLAGFDGALRAETHVAEALAQAMYRPSDDALILVADRIAPGDEQAVYLHEVVHRHMRRGSGAGSFERLVSVVKGWTERREDSVERRVFDAALARTAFAGVELAHQDEELLAYAVEEAVRLGVRPSLAASNETAEHWLGDVVATIQGVIYQEAGAIIELNAQQLVNLAYAFAQLDRPDYGPRIREALASYAHERADSVADVLRDRHEGASAVVSSFSGPNARQVGGIASTLANELHNGYAPSDEICDAGAALRPHDDWIEKAKAGVLKISDVIDHPALFGSYPLLAEMPVDLGAPERAVGALSVAPFAISLSPLSLPLAIREPGKFMRIFVGEIQRAVQAVEGCVPGVDMLPAYADPRAIVGASQEECDAVHAELIVPADGCEVHRMRA